jgi:pre-mRNA-splicing factor ATP-dependent RNA helicase DHX15/PRP43
MQQADNVRNQLKRSMEKMDLFVVCFSFFSARADPFPHLHSDLVSTNFEDKSYYDNIRRALTCGFFMHVAHREGDKNGYTTVKDNQIVGLHPSNGLDNNPEWVLYNGRSTVLASFAWPRRRILPSSSLSPRSCR